MIPCERFECLYERFNFNGNTNKTMRDRYKQRHIQKDRAQRHKDGKI